MVNLIAVDEQDHVCVLLNCARLTKVRGHRALVWALLALARKLAEQHNRNAELACKQLASATYAADLFSAIATLAFHQL
ncbi:hypothetical protein D9M71_596260 [compost metagenome]